MKTLIPTFGTTELEVKNGVRNVTILFVDHSRKKARKMLFQWAENPAFFGIQDVQAVYGLDSATMDGKADDTAIRAEWDEHLAIDTPSGSFVVDRFNILS
jgi:hypothetical protein